MNRTEITDPADWQVGDHARIEWPGSGGATFCIEGPFQTSEHAPGDAARGRVAARFDGGASTRVTVTVTREVDDRVDTSIGIFALPREDDPINQVSSEAHPHVTMLFFGDQADFKGDIDLIGQQVEEVARASSPVTETVKSRGVLGDGQADVLHLSSDGLGKIRAALLQHAEVKAAFDNFDQYPTWITHLTLGYPDHPAKGDVTSGSITFDRIALWVGEDLAVFDLGPATVTREAPDEGAP
jgi:2'-5' RNA ligase